MTSNGRDPARALTTFYQTWFDTKNDGLGLTAASEERVAADIPPVLVSRLHPVAAATPPKAKMDVALAATTVAG